MTIHAQAVGMPVNDSIQALQTSIRCSERCLDSLQTLLVRCQREQDSLQANHIWQKDQMRKEIFRLEQVHDSLLLSNQTFQRDLQQKNNLLEETVGAFQEKETLFKEKESLYQEAIALSNVDKAKLEGQIDTKNASIEAKNTQIDYLQANIRQKEASLEQQQRNVDRITRQNESYMMLADSLRTRLTEAEKKIIQTGEALKYTEKRAKDAETKVQAAVNRKKKVCVVQGIAMKNFRTPSW